MMNESCLTWFHLVLQFTGREQLQGGYEDPEAGGDEVFHPGGAAALGHACIVHPRHRLTWEEG